MKFLKRGKPRVNKKAVDLVDEIKNGKKIVKFNMNIDRKKHQQFKAKCALNGIEMKEVLMKAIDEYISI